MTDFLKPLTRFANWIKRHNFESSQSPCALVSCSHSRASSNTLYLAFGERVDHGALYAIEKILACRTQPCVAGRKSIACQLDSMRQLPHPSDVEFGPMNDLAEMARIASSYTARLSPEALRVSRIGRFIWLRLDVPAGVRAHVGSKPCPIATNVVFRLSSDSSRPFPSPRPFR